MKDKELTDHDLTFEKAIEALEEIVEKMEMEDISLEESIRLFERGVRLTRYCSEKLDEAEGKITMILERNTHNEKKTTFDID
ncbi:MAG TPA: exodeoxyribonuclease VII small subunit [Clostridiales bacterium]|nr:exodeoxyribonuclease VII small subunit [Clostridiales bacterium]